MYNITSITLTLKNNFKSYKIEELHPTVNAHLKDN